MSRDKRFLQIEKQVDEAMCNLPIYKINREDALKLVISIYESFEMGIAAHILQNKNNLQVVSEAEKKSQALKGALVIAVQHIYMNCPETEGENVGGQTVIDQCIDLLDKSNKYYYVEVNYKGMRPGILTPNIEEDSPENITISFQPVDDKIHRYEIINEILIEENSSLFRDRMAEITKKMQIEYPKLHNWRTMDAYYSAIAKSQVDLLFNFPDEMELAGYRVGDIKNVWCKLLYKIYMKSHRNRIKCLPYLINNLDLPEEMLPEVLCFINVEEFDGVNKNVVEVLLDNLTYGTMKGKQKYGSFMTEPIIKLTDGSRFVSPTFISHNLAGRNINATLNRIYAGTVDKDTELKEAFFVSEVEAVLKLFPELKGGGPTQLPGELPDVDFAIYDPISKAMIALEMKWITEPITAQEIVSRDEDLEKGLQIQLPKYEEGITADLDAFMKKTFDVSYPVSFVDYFVLTKVSIGSGKINDDSNKIINIRMLKKALYDYDGNLHEAVENIQAGKYLPQENVHYKKIKNKYEFAGVNFITDGKEILEQFSLRTPDDLISYPGKIE